MKILIVSDFYPPIIGGAERHVSSLSKGLVRKGHEVIVCTIWHKHLRTVEEENGVKVNRLEGIFQRIPFLFKDPRKRFAPPFQDWLLTKKLENMIEKEQPDIVHVHGWILYSVIPLRKRFNIPMVMTLHDYGLICPKRTLLKANHKLCHEPFTSKCVGCGKETYGPLKSFLTYQGVRLNKNQIKLVDKFVAVSSFVKEVISESLSLSDREIVVVPNFCDANEMNRNNEPKEAVKFPKDFILFVGRLSPLKGVDILIEACRRTKLKTNLVLIGSGSDYEDEYRDTNNIMMIKNAPHEIVMEACRKCMFVVIPSLGLEACPTVALEAMSSRKAVIASRIGGLKEIVIDGETGFLVPPGDSKKLARTIDQLLQDPILTEKLGEKGLRRFLQNYESKVVIPQIERVYASLLQRSSRKVGGLNR